MPKRKSASRASASKAGKPGKAAKGGQSKEVAKYFVDLPARTRTSLEKLRSAIRAVVPRAATETISYRIPAFKHNGIIVWYAAFSDHCSLFPTAVVIQEFQDELKGFSTSKGTIHFPFGKPLPIGLIKKIVRARLRRMEE